MDDKNLYKWEILNGVKKALLIEPDFPYPTKSRNHKDFLPIGLLKISTYLKMYGIEVELVKMSDGLIDTIDVFNPDIIFVTSLFTYWSSYVKDVVDMCKRLCDAPVVVGGIYASLMPDHCREYTGCDHVHSGVISTIEDFNHEHDLPYFIRPDYDLVDVDYQIIHTSRGCLRKCEFCGVSKIEPDLGFKNTIELEFVKKKLIFYDNNLLANDYIDEILNELITAKENKEILYCESQSGFDGRILQRRPGLARKLKLAGFRNIKIAWDGGFEDFRDISTQLDILVDAGFKKKDIMVFILFNYDIPYNICEAKRVMLWNYGVQIANCRYIPLDVVSDDYNPRMKVQTPDDYYIHPVWTDEEVRLFKRNVRRHNMCIRFGTKYYSKSCEQKKVPHYLAKRYRNEDYFIAKKVIYDAWNPAMVQEVDLVTW